MNLAAISSSFGGVPARVAELQARFGLNAPVQRVRAPVSETPEANGRPADFDAVLNSVLESAQAQSADAMATSSAIAGLPTTAGTTATTLDWRGVEGALPVGTPFAELFTQAAERHGVPARVLAAVAQVESRFDPTATSTAGATGLMQFMPGTASSMGVDPRDPASAVDGAARLLRRHLDRFGSLDLALAVYNAGEGSVTRYGGIPPFAQTQAYVPKVLGLARGGNQ